MVDTYDNTFVKTHRKYNIKTKLTELGCVMYHCSRIDSDNVPSALGFDSGKAVGTERREY